MTFMHYNHISIQRMSKRSDAETKLSYRGLLLPALALLTWAIILSPFVF